MTDFDFSKIRSALELLLGPSLSASLVDTKNQCHAVRGLTPSDLGTLPQAAWTSNEYLNLYDGDIVLLNDPYSGNSHLHSMTLIMGIRLFAKKGGPADFLLSHRLNFKPMAFSSEHLDQEGLRIPPSPIFHAGNFNEHLLEAVSSHPLCPEEFSSRVKSAVLQLVDHHKGILETLSLFDISKTTFKEYSTISKEKFLAFLNEWNNHDGCVDKRLKDGTSLSLKLSVRNQNLVFDFTGSEKSDSVFLTHGAAMGGCLWALNRSLPKRSLLGAGILNQVDIISPQKSAFNAKYPSPAYQGLTEGANLIAQMASEAIQKLNPLGIQEAQTSHNQCSIHIKFNSGKVFFDQVVPGQGASKLRRGQDAQELWTKPYLNNCIEEIEHRYPIHFRSIRLREKSGGHGTHPGGQGISKNIELLEDGVLSWNLLEPHLRPQGSEGGKPGAPFEAHVQRGKEKINLTGNETFELKAGDVLSIQSAGGGGFGPEQDDDL